MIQLHLKPFTSFFKYKWGYHSMNGVTTELKLVRAVTTTNNYIHTEEL